MKTSPIANVITRMGFPRCHFNPNRRNGKPIVVEKKKEYKVEDVVDIYA